MAASEPHAQELVEEAQVKAAYLHKFPSFVEWPDGASPTGAQPFVIGVAGGEAIFSHMSRIARERLVQGRAVEVRRITDSKSAQSVHVLFIGHELSRSSALAWIASVQNRPILTVVEDLGLQSQAILNFVVRDGNVRFEASIGAAAKAGLKLSSRLLAVAAFVDNK